MEIRGSLGIIRAVMSTQRTLFGARPLWTRPMPHQEAGDCPGRKIGTSDPPTLKRNGRSHSPMYAASA